MEICKITKELIVRCLESNDKNRPTFKIICKELWRIKEKLLTGKEVPPTPIPEVTESQQFQFLKVISTRRKTVLIFELSFFKKRNLKFLPIGGQLNDIIFPCINIDDSGRAHLIDENIIISRPFTEDDGVDPQNKPFGNLPQDLGVVGQFKKLLIDQGKTFDLSLGIHTSYQGILGDESLKFISEFLRVYKIFNGIYIQYHGTVKAIHVNMQLQKLRKALPGLTIGLSPSTDILPSIGGDIRPDMFDHLYISANYLRRLPEHHHVPSIKIIIDIIDGESELNLVEKEDLGGVVFSCNENNHELFFSAQPQQSPAESERVASDLPQQNIVGDNDVAQTKEDLIPQGCARLEYQRQCEVAQKTKEENKKNEESQEDGIALVAAPVYHDEPMDTDLPAIENSSHSLNSITSLPCKHVNAQVNAVASDLHNSQNLEDDDVFHEAQENDDSAWSSDKSEAKSNRLKSVDDVYKDEANTRLELLGL